MGIRNIKKQIENLSTDYGIMNNDPRVRALIQTIKKENEAKVNELKLLLSETKPTIKKRWPDFTPEEIKDYCSKYWSGTEQYKEYRIHCWNEKGIWTSYPAGGYSDNMGFHSTTSMYFLIKRGICSGCHCTNSKIMVLEKKEGRTAPSYMKEKLNALMT